MWNETRIIGRKKVTKNAQSPYLTELNGHKIGHQYIVSPSAARHTLVLIDPQGHCVLVNGSGIGHNTLIDRLDDYSRLPYDDEVVLEGEEPPKYYFDWLTWRANDTQKTYKHGPLSNFWVENDGKTLEHRFAALKTTDFYEKQWIMVQPTPGLAKKAGRKATLRPDWDEIKRDLLWDLLLKKFLSDDFAWKYLVATGDAIIREKNTWNDTIWGVNMNNQGQNLLGMGLMYVRQVLQDIEDMPREL